GFSGETAGGRQRISREQLDVTHCPVAPANGRDYVRANVAQRSIAGAIHCAKDHARLRLTAEFIVAETQMRLAAVVNLDYEMIVEATAAEQVAARVPTP